MPKASRVASLVFLLLAIGASAPSAQAPAAAQQKPRSLSDYGDNEIIGLDLMSIRDGHGGPQYFPIDGDPIAGQPHLVAVQVFRGASKVALEARDATGKLMTSIPMERSRPPASSDHTKHWAAMLTMPAQAARLYVTGVLEDGKEFRTRSTRVDPKCVAIRMDYVPSVVGGRPLDYEIDVRNFGPAERFELTVTDDAHSYGRRASR